MSYLTSPTKLPVRALCHVHITHLHRKNQVKSPYKKIHKMLVHTLLLHKRRGQQHAQANSLERVVNRCRYDIRLEAAAPDARQRCKGRPHNQCHCRSARRTHPRLHARVVRPLLSPRPRAASGTPYYIRYSWLAQHLRKVTNQVGARKAS